LLGRLDQMGVQPVEIELVDHRPPGQHRLQSRHAQFARLFRDQVDPPLLDRRAAQPEIGHHLRRLGLLHAFQHQVALADIARPRRPFARLAVEQQHDIVRLHPHHADEVMGAVAIHRHGDPFAQQRFDMQARGALRRPGGGSGHFVSSIPAALVVGPIFPKEESAFPTSAGRTELQ
jgi:hypothetical protein